MPTSCCNWSVFGVQRCSCCCMKDTGIRSSSGHLLWQDRAFEMHKCKEQHWLWPIASSFKSSEKTGSKLVRDNCDLAFNSKSLSSLQRAVHSSFSTISKCFKDQNEWHTEPMWTLSMPWCCCPDQHERVEADDGHMQSTMKCHSAWHQKLQQQHAKTWCETMNKRQNNCGFLKAADCIRIGSLATIGMSRLLSSLLELARLTVACCFQIHAVAASPQLVPVLHICWFPMTQAILAKNVHC